MYGSGRTAHVMIQEEEETNARIRVADTNRRK